MLKYKIPKSFEEFVDSGFEGLRTIYEYARNFFSESREKIKNILENPEEYKEKFLDTTKDVFSTIKEKTPEYKLIAKYNLKKRTNENLGEEDIEEIKDFIKQKFSNIDSKIVNFDSFTEHYLAGDEIKKGDNFVKVELEDLDEIINEMIEEFISNVKSVHNILKTTKSISGYEDKKIIFEELEKYGSKAYTKIKEALEEKIEKFSSKHISQEIITGGLNKITDFNKNISEFINTENFTYKKDNQEPPYFIYKDIDFSGEVEESDKNNNEKNVEVKESSTNNDDNIEKGELDVKIDRIKEKIAEIKTKYLEDRNKLRQNYNEKKEKYEKGGYNEEVLEKLLSTLGENFEKDLEELDSTSLESLEKEEIILKVLIGQKYELTSFVENIDFYKKNKPIILDTHIKMTKVAIDSIKNSNIPEKEKKDKIFFYENEIYQLKKIKKQLQQEKNEK